MGFWIFMLLVDIFTPALMLGIGLWFLKKPPTDINAFIGYRTGMSTKNQDCWDLAHRCCGRLWFWLGLALLPLSAVPLLFFLGRDNSTVSLVGVSVMTAQLLILLGSIIPVEISLHKHFDKDGNRKEGIL